MTIGLWVTAGVLGVLGIIITIWVGYSAWSYGSRWVLRSLVCLLIVAMVFGAVVGVGHWYCNNTASGVRALKDEQSNLNNGLMREIIITAEDGREIFRYKGKCDIETNVGYILFEGEDGLRRIIYYGALDTIIITELP